jgi:hypothetical protein
VVRLLFSRAELSRRIYCPWLTPHPDQRRTSLVIIWHLLSNPAARFTDLGYGYYQARTDTNRKLRNHIRQIQALGFDVTITQAA